ncbi:hypothetical protein F9U64_00700 [Gracilibacillus oryzae]|uniref:YtkA-like domain-containing protein n=1 Tax=Gracilibacillus oryzae TaxID=1672701 RepID=A0A7C8KUK8_9BACI|nr:FixH family protein [Gracilibacillus oryzae]KAB8139346.1 hypothetical protein F9U64_00700 [Gracilibacillus oryzae]
MRKTLVIVLLFLFVTACSSNSSENNKTEENTMEEPKSLEVNFDLPESAETGKAVPLKATVTYGEEMVADAEEMSFEYWNVEDEANKTMVESVNNNDGTYTAEVTFQQPGTYEIYAHTTARELHTIPKKSITVTGEPTEEHSHPSHEDTEHSHQHQNENFHMQFTTIETAKVNEEITLTVSPMLDEQPLENAEVRYEIIQDGEKEHKWLDATEQAGVYTATHTFAKTGSSTVVIHVTNDEGLHEHEEHSIEVTE